MLVVARSRCGACVMIADIRNQWLRRSVLVAALVLYVPFVVVMNTIELLWESWLELRRDVPAAWRGPE